MEGDGKLIVHQAEPALCGKSRRWSTGDVKCFRGASDEW